VRLPLALLLALVFLGAFTVFQHYSAKTYDAEVAFSVAGSHGCSAGNSIAITEYCCLCTRYVVWYCFGMDARGDVRGDYTVSRVRYYTHRMIVSKGAGDAAADFFSSWGFRVYLCRGASRALDISLPPPDRYHGLLRQAEVHAYVHAQMGRIVVTEVIPSSPGYAVHPGTSDYVVRLAESRAYITCREDGQRSYELGIAVCWFNVTGEPVRGVADALFVFVRLDQPASLVEIEAAHPRWGVQRAAAAPPEGGPDLSGVVALYPAGVRQEVGETVKVAYSEFGNRYEYAYMQTWSRYYIQLAAERADGGQIALEVPADAAVVAGAWSGPPQPVTDVVVNASAPACEQTPNCTCTGTLVLRVEDYLMRAVHETPPVAARGGAVALPVGRHALLFVLAWPAPLSAGDSPANYTVTVRVKGIRPRLVR